MECPYCGAELEQVDVYGYLAAHQSGEILGEIYKCPNHEGFQNYEDAEKYIFENPQLYEDSDYPLWNEFYCESSSHRVSGSFYTMNGNLEEGFPC